MVFLTKVKGWLGPMTLQEQNLKSLIIEVHILEVVHNLSLPYGVVSTILHDHEEDGLRIITIPIINLRVHNPD